MQFLQKLTMSQNKLKELPPIQQPRLTKLSLNENEIDTAARFEGHQTLLLLELRKNKLTACIGLHKMRVL